LSLTVAALFPALPVVAAYLQAVSKSAGKLNRAVKEKPPAQAGGFLFPSLSGNWDVVRR
jgi:hypothetical protein